MRATRMKYSIGRPRLRALSRNTSRRICRVHCRSADPAAHGEYYCRLYFASARLSACIGGHGVEPNEQKTQQSPGLGLSRPPQPVQS